MEEKKEVGGEEEEDCVYSISPSFYLESDKIMTALLEMLSDLFSIMSRMEVAR